MNIVSVQRALESCVDDEREYRFAAWKNKMADDKAALAWLRRRPQVVSPAVCVNKRDPVASSVQEAIRNIVIFRYRIWHRTPVDMDVVWPQVIQQVPHRDAMQWQVFSGAHLRRAADDCRNRASDGWTPFDMSLFSDATWGCIAKFYNIHCLRFGKVPDIGKAFWQIQISKGAPLSNDSSTCVNDLRPISVSSLMWRVCQKPSSHTRIAKPGLLRPLPYTFMPASKGVALTMP